ncbi:hypothetical protein TNCV_1556771 [Trichonephila clavipes]|nr:hypothetical protein TNCV_1556771 [Trichonephila clavipes]
MRFLQNVGRCNAEKFYILIPYAARQEIVEKNYTGVQCRTNMQNIATLLIINKCSSVWLDAIVHTKQNGLPQLLKKVACKVCNEHLATVPEENYGVVYMRPTLSVVLQGWVKVHSLGNAGIEETSLLAIFITLVSIPLFQIQQQRIEIAAYGAMYLWLKSEPPRVTLSNPLSAAPRCLKPFP